MSFQVMAWAAEQKTGSPTNKAVLMALANAANHHTGDCHPSVERLAEETEFGVTAVKRALKDLADDGFIERTRRRRGDGSLGTYDYAFPHLGKRREAADHSREASLDLEPGGVPLNQERPSNLESEEPSGSSLAVAAPKLTKVGGRDIAFDALAEVCRVNVEQGNRARDVGIALNGTKRQRGIRELFWQEASQPGFRMLLDAAPMTAGEAFEMALAVEIRARSRRYVEVLPGAVLTPMALAKWWADLPGMEAGRRTQGGSATDAARVAADELQRMRGGG